MESAGSQGGGVNRGARGWRNKGGLFAGSGVALGMLAVVGVGVVSKHVWNRKRKDFSGSEAPEAKANGGSIQGPAVVAEGKANLTNGKVNVEHGTQEGVGSEHQTTKVANVFGLRESSKRNHEGINGDQLHAPESGTLGQNGLLNGIRNGLNGEAQSHREPKKRSPEIEIVDSPSPEIVAFDGDLKEGELKLATTDRSPPAVFMNSSRERLAKAGYSLGTSTEEPARASIAPENPRVEGAFDAPQGKRPVSPDSFKPPSDKTESKNGDSDSLNGFPGKSFNVGGQLQQSEICPSPLECSGTAKSSVSPYEMVTSVTDFLRAADTLTDSIDGKVYIDGKVCIHGRVQRLKPQKQALAEVLEDYREAVAESSRPEVITEFDSERTDAVESWNPELLKGNGKDPSSKSCDVVDLQDGKDAEALLNVTACAVSSVCKVEETAEGIKVEKVVKQVTLLSAQQAGVSPTEVMGLKRKGSWIEGLQKVLPIEIQLIAILLGCMTMILSVVWRYQNPLPA